MEPAAGPEVSRSEDPTVRAAPPEIREQVEVLRIETRPSLWRPSCLAYRIVCDRCGYEGLWIVGHGYLPPVSRAMILRLESGTRVVPAHTCPSPPATKP